MRSVQPGPAATPSPRARRSHLSRFAPKSDEMSSSGEDIKRKGCAHLRLPPRLLDGLAGLGGVGGVHKHPQHRLQSVARAHGGSAQTTSRLDNSARCRWTPKPQRAAGATETAARLTTCTLRTECSCCCCCCCWRCRCSPGAGVVKALLPASAAPARPGTAKCRGGAPKPVNLAGAALPPPPPPPLRFKCASSSSAPKLPPSSSAPSSSPTSSSSSRFRAAPFITTRDTCPNLASRACTEEVSGHTCRRPERRKPADSRPGLTSSNRRSLSSGVRSSRSSSASTGPLVEELRAGGARAAGAVAAEPLVGGFLLLVVAGPLLLALLAPDTGAAGFFLLGPRGAGGCGAGAEEEEEEEDVEALRPLRTRSRRSSRSLSCCFLLTGCCCGGGADLWLGARVRGPALGEATAWHAAEGALWCCSWATLWPEGAAWREACISRCGGWARVERASSPVRQHSSVDKWPLLSACYAERVRFLAFSQALTLHAHLAASCRRRARFHDTASRSANTSIFSLVPLPHLFPWARSFVSGPRAALLAAARQHAIAATVDRQPMGRKQRVIIIGAGFAGLAAARTLLAQSDSREVVVLEASSCVGGRCKTGVVRGRALSRGGSAFSRLGGRACRDDRNHLAKRRARPQRQPSSSARGAAPPWPHFAGTSIAPAHESQLPSGTCVELGATWFHGVRDNPVYDVAVWQGVVKDIRCDPGACPTNAAGPRPSASHA